MSSEVRAGYRHALEDLVGITVLMIFVLLRAARWSLHRARVDGHAVHAHVSNRNAHAVQLHRLRHALVGPRPRVVWMSVYEERAFPHLLLYNFTGFKVPPPSLELFLHHL